MSTVRILLATYNGEKYIGDMIESILAQSFTDWQLVLSDDQSKDHTVSILEEYAVKYPDRIMHYRSGLHFGNAQGHFLHLLNQFPDAPYIMFCDQDDIWHNDKVSATLQKMKEIEKSGVPALVHTDLRVVDGQLQEMHPSFLAYSGISGERMELKQLLVQNVVTGCTMMLNRPMAELANAHMPAGKILMHDWWLALIGAAMGTVGFLNQPTIDYRQHGNNTVGAKDTKSLSYILKKIRNDGVRKAMEDTYDQAEIFLEAFGDLMAPEQRQVVADYAALKNRSAMGRRLAFVKDGFYKYGLQRIIAQFIWS